MRSITNLTGVLKMLNSNRADLFVCDSYISAKYIAKKEGLNNIIFKEINFLKPSTILYKLALRKDFPDAQKILDNYDKNFLIAQKQGLIDKIIKEHEYHK